MAGTHVFPDDVPILTDGEVTLRAHALSDVDTLMGQCTDPLSIRWTTVPVPYSRDDAVHFVTKIVPACWTDGSELAFAVEAPHADGVRRFGGTVSLRIRGDDVAEVAFGLHPGVRGRGVGATAVRLLARWGFETQGLQVITWYAEVGNWASRRVAWASGFSFDGTVPALLLQRGERKDAWVGSVRLGEELAPRHEWISPPALETDRLRLRPFADADADRFAELLRDERSRHFSGRVAAVRALRSGAEALHRVREACAAGERYEWAIADRTTDRLVGHLQLHDLGGVDDTEAKPAYKIHPDSRGRGYLTEALTAMTEWTFRPTADGGLGLRRVSLLTAASNTASRYAAERAGYVHIATEPDAFPIGDTDFDAMAIYHRLNPDWRLSPA
ncbi:GNAT family N-acetyltransferase [Actinophytocola gossypii]|uniref:GNAT N-acetyltransferase n=1 Tax=Actinophytocola gossypii TaxID=2812003 RepID=A0ABT2JFH7_9PSEU|nr:GNAT family N-acetyltransferase [Actinophytocola gossypii]MCT2586628.1 GNAT N-acetyltransferase [Actinophytocola gossypii]